MSEIIKKMVNRIDNDFLKKSEFIHNILACVLERTNEELDEINMPDFLDLLKEKDRYPGEFQHAFYIFELKLSMMFTTIKAEIMKGILKES